MKKKWAKCFHFSAAKNDTMNNKPDEKQTKKKRTSSKWEEIIGKLTYITALKLSGVSDDELCSRLNISKATFRKYKEKYPQFKEAVSIDREVADGMVEAALLRSATGYTVTSRKIYKLKNTYYDDREKKVEEERLEYADEEQRVPPNLSAQTFWLKNRRPELWSDKTDKDRRDNDAGGDGGIVILPADGFDVLEVADEE